MNQALKAGDFTGLANDYSHSSPDYCPAVLNALLGLLDKPAFEVDFVDVGAGTGIWTRMVHDKGLKSITAVEPNDDMRNNGIADSSQQKIKWLAGCAENTGLPHSSCDWLTMASSLHWANFEVAIRESHRVLRPGGRFTALWNPQLIDVNPLLVEIEDFLHTLQPDIKRACSDRFGITETLTERLWDSPYFEDVVYLEGRHVIPMSKDRYLGAWRSANDLRVQLDPLKFEALLTFVERRIANQDVIEATYLTRAWSARSKD